MRKRTLHMTLRAALLALCLAAGVAYGQGGDQELAAGLTLMDDKDLDGAIAQFEAAVAAAPELSATHFFLGQALVRKAQQWENPAEQAAFAANASAALQRAIELSPETPQGHLYLGHAYLLTEAYDLALAEFETELGLSRPQRREEIYDGIGLAFTGLGRYVEAVDAFEFAIDLDRNYCGAMYDLAKTLYKMGEYEKAAQSVRDLNDVMREYRRHLNTLNRQMALYKRKADVTPEWVDQEYRYAADFASRQPEAFKLVGRAYHELGEFGNSRNAYRQAMLEANDGNADDVDAQTMIVAEMLADARDRIYQRNLVLDPWKILMAADEALGEVLDTVEDYAPAHNVQGEIYLLQAEVYLPNEDRGIEPADIGKARESFEKAVEIYAVRMSDPTALAPLRDPDNYAQAEMNLGKTDMLAVVSAPGDAIPHFEQARQLSPGHPEATALLAKARAELGDADAALALMTEALAAQPDEAILQNVNGELLMALGKPTEAARAFQLTIELEPSLVEAHINLGTAMFQTESWSAARASFDVALGRLPESTLITLAAQRAELHRMVGLCYLNDGIPSHAVDSFNECLALNSSHLEAERDLAEAYSQLDNYDAAESALRAALLLAEQAADQVRADLHVSLGWLYRDMGRFHDAYVQAAVAGALVPDHQGASELSEFVRGQLGAGASTPTAAPAETPAEALPAEEPPAEGEGDGQ